MTVSRRQMMQFIWWVAKEVCREEFEEEAGAFAEIACRKLHSLGVVEKKEDKWVYESGGIV